MPKKPKGWVKEPVRHGLAAKGVKTTNPALPPQLGGNMFCPECGTMMRVVDGKRICPKHDAGAFAELELAQKEFEKCHVWRGGKWHRKDTPALLLARQERTIGEFLDNVPGAHRATKQELRDMGVSPQAYVAILKDGRTVNLHTNLSLGPNHRFALGIRVKIALYDYMALALTDDNPGTPTEWWFMNEEEIVQHREMGEGGDAGYLPTSELSSYRSRWDRIL